MEGQLSLGILLGLILVALAFDFMNGFHDAANSIATLVSTRVLKPLAFIFSSPIVGMLFGALLMLAVSWIFVRSTPSKVDRWFRRLQLISSSLYSLGHGGNDAQKTIGIIWMLLIGAGYLGARDP